MRKIIYLTVSIFFIFLWFKLVDVPKALAILLQGKMIFIILAIIIGFLGSLLAALRMKILFSAIADVPLFYIFALAYISALVTNVFPIFLGGFFISYLIAQKIRISFKKAFLIVFVDYLFSLLITPILVLIALIYYSQNERMSVGIGNLDIHMLILVALVFTISIFALRNVIKSFFHNYQRYLRKSYKLFLVSKLILFKSLSITLVIAFLGFINRYLYFLAYDLRSDFKEFVLAFGLFDLLNLIPGAPLKIGQYETFGVLTLPYLLNLDKTRIFAILLLQHAISVLMVIVIGLISLNILKIDLNIINKFKLDRPSSRLK